jgi:hypothetical protein
MKTKQFISVLLLSICASRLVAQNDDCELTLNRAAEEFNAGHFYTIPSVLSPCLDKFSVEQRQRAYLLLTQTYLLLDDPLGAKQSYLGVLKANPEFLTDTALHPIDVIYLSKKFTATSIFSWFAKAGTNVSVVRPIFERSTVGESTIKLDYKMKVGYQAAVGGDLNLSEKIHLRGEAMFSMATYEQVSVDFFNRDSKSVIDRQNWISIPVTFIYSDDYGKFRPYGYAGYAFHYLLADKANITITNDRPSGTSSDLFEREKTPEESPTLDLLYMRNRFNQSIVVGGGLKVKVGLDFLFIDLRYSIGLKNVVSEKNAYADYSEADLTSASFIRSMDTATRYMHVDDYFRLDNLALSVGFLRPLYKPRELKRARTRSVMKQMKNK